MNKSETPIKDFVAKIIIGITLISIPSFIFGPWIVKELLK